MKGINVSVACKKPCRGGICQRWVKPIENNSNIFNKPCKGDIKLKLLSLKEN